MARYLRDGFPRQRMRVLPRPLVEQTLTEVVTRRLLVTDAGYFPHAANHGRLRRRGAREAVVLLCLDGRGWCEIEGSLVSVQPGQALVIAPRVPHLYRADASDPWTLWWLHALGDDLDDLLEPILAGAGYGRVRLHDPAPTMHAMEQAVRALERDETAPSLLAAAGAGWHVLTQIGADRLAGPRDATSPVQQAREYLMENFDLPIRVPDLAARVGLSASHFAAMFRKATGGGVLEYLKRIRMARARVLLVSTDLTIAEVARAVGYDDAFYFSRQFRAVAGASPSQFRQASRAERVPPLS